MVALANASARLTALVAPNVFEGGEGTISGVSRVDCGSKQAPAARGQRLVVVFYINNYVLTEWAQPEQRARCNRGPATVPTAVRHPQRSLLCSDKLALATNSLSVDAVVRTSCKLS